MFLSKQEKRLEVAKQVDIQLLRLRTAVFQKIEKAFLSNAIPDDWLEDDNAVLALAIMESLHKDAALDLKRFTKRTAKEIKNLHLFL
jgi:hypothetical protein